MYVQLVRSSSLPVVAGCLPRRLEQREPSGLCRGKVTNENIGHAKSNPTLSDGIIITVACLMRRHENVRITQRTYDS